MPFFVCKFGGTSLKNGDMFLKVREIVRENPARRLIVVSAPGKRSPADEKITDLLKRFSETKEDAVFSKIEERFLEIADKAGIDIGEELSRIRKRILLGADAEYAMSRGEKLSAMLMAKCLEFPFVDAKEVIRFRGNALETKTDALLNAAFLSRGCMVLPGFYGADETGQIRLFPRGGSDITGAVAARAVHADLYENWTDVDGVYDRDPARHADARLYEKMSYAEMRIACENGASVLHPDSLLPVMEKNIPVRVKNTFRPGAKGTLIFA